MISSPESQSPTRGPTGGGRKLQQSANLLYQSLQKPKPDQSVDLWISIFKSDRVGAIADLVNFLLMCAGSSKNRIPRDVDLEALGPEEIDALLTDMLQEMQEAEGGHKYPIGSQTKESRSLRQRFVVFWERLSTRLISNLDDAQGARSIELLRVIVDILITFSSYIVVNVRDAVTEAAMSIARQIAFVLADLRMKVQVATRQLNADSNKSKKFSAVSKEKKTSDKLLSALCSLLEHVFNSIFIHRQKDYSAQVRASCVSNLGDLVWTLLPILTTFSGFNLLFWCIRLLLIPSFSTKTCT